tara:strand:- start:2531 stop:3850 length:1320 start_codon:yes stop_codon:yes gene_type:complete
MKKFSQFIFEAKETRVSQQAKSLGLVGNGHGDWYDSKGEFAAKTVEGKLKFFNKGERVGQRDIPPKPGAKTAQPIPTAGQIQPTQTSQIQQQPTETGQEQELPGDGEFLTVVFARFNPPTKEHKKLFDTANRISSGGEIRIYPSRTQDTKKNPLNANKKISFMRKMFPGIADIIVNNPEMKTIFDVLISANEDGYSNINIIVGSDRLSEMQSLSAKHNGKFYEFTEIKVIPTGNFDAEKNSAGISSGMLRKAAADNDYREFKRGMPKDIDENDVRLLFNAVRKGMGFKEKMKENYNLWEISPELDYKNLRENFISNKIFKINDIVENLNTGLVGKVIRRGTNYLICVTEEDVMFKSWIKDLMEYTEVKMDSKYRELGKPNTLVGTLGAFKYVADVTPGFNKGEKTNLQFGAKPYKGYSTSNINFINKYRKIKESIYFNV